MALDGTLVVTPEVRYSPRYMREHLGASQWAAALGESPFESPAELWEVFIGQRLPFEDTKASKLGRYLEDGVAQMAAEELGVTIARCSTMEHPWHRWSCATPDRVILETVELLQVKTTGLATRLPFTILDEAWGEGGDNVPDHVLIQCLGELFVTRAAWQVEGVRDIACPELAGTPLVLPTRNRVAALIPGRSVCHFAVEWDEEVATHYFGRAADFWRFVVARTLPPPDATVGYGQALARSNPRHTPGEWLDGDDLEVAMLAAQYRQALDARTWWERAVTFAENVIKQRIGAREGVRGSWGAIPYRTRRTHNAGSTRAFGPARWKA